MKLRRLFYLGGVFFLVLVKFTIDVVGKNVELEIGGLRVIRELLVVGSFGLLYFLAHTASFWRDQSPIKRLGVLLIAMAASTVVILGLTSAPVGGFDAKNLSLLPLDYPTLFVASLLSLLLGAFALLIVRLMRDLILYNRKGGTERNLVIFFGLVLATSLSTVVLKPLDSNIVTSILFALSLVFALVNSFRLQWIVFLTKREKVFNLVYAFLLFVGFTLFNVAVLQGSTVSRSLLYYSYPLRQFVLLVSLSGNIFFGMTFVSTLFHLPTAEAFDRKRSEVTSLHNLSRLVTQVFDFNELVDTVTAMTLQVCEAQSSWLEIIHTGEEIPRSTPGAPRTALVHVRTGGYYIQVAGMKNITQEEIDQVLSPAEESLRDVVIRSRTPAVVDDLTADPRFRHLRKAKLPISSIVVVPLVSRGGLLGILYATKSTRYGFVKDDVDVISAFADQATVAIENSRLIKESIEREHLTREMLVAQEMQRKLLPQALPDLGSVDVDAISTPAFEVGGDYYDFMKLEPCSLGIVVGDVSGKGVSAAFYMAEVKGIFQSLSRMYDSPKKFMIRANEALARSIDRRSFVSLIYAIVNVESGRLTISRAGHCPMLLVSGERVEYIRPNGMGMGLSMGRKFDDAIEEISLQLNDGDVCVFYTDGVTEARRGEEEFGYERLLETARGARSKPASAIKDEILETVKRFIDYQPSHDDLTLVVLKWRGSPVHGNAEIV